MWNNIKRSNIYVESQKENIGCEIEKKIEEIMSDNFTDF